MKKRKVLFFIKRSMPTKEEIKIAESFEGCHVCYRNANFIGDNEKPEQCEAVAGLIPSVYEEFERAEDLFNVEEKPEKPLTKAQEKAQEKALAKAKKAEEEAQEKALAKVELEETDKVEEKNEEAQTPTWTPQVAK